MIKKILILLILSIFFLSSVSCSKKNINKEPYSETEFMLGTVVTLTIYDKETEKPSKKIVNEAISRIKEIEKKMSININGSEVIRINEQAGKDFHTVSEETFYVIEKGKYFSELSNGSFDITIGPLVKLWGIGTEDAHVPSDKEIHKALSLVNYKNISLDEVNTSVKLDKKGMILDLGSIAKGYAADEIVRIFKKYNVKSALINLGGNVFAYGTKPNGNQWNIGINDPANKRSKIVGSVSVSNKTVVSSGIYERNFEEKGVLYHHILDTVTGFPVKNGLVSVSVITESSIDADSLSTTVFSLGLENGLSLIEDLDNTEGLFITDENKIYLSSGIKEKFNLTNESYTVVE